MTNFKNYNIKKKISKIKVNLVNYIVSVFEKSMNIKRTSLKTKIF